MVVSSSGTSYFNDMLGTTLGSRVKGKKYSAAALTAFGESMPVDSPNSQLTTPNSQTFYTGKPHVAGLGHAFLFRNYRAGLAKWQTADPLGYLDGWNQLAYCCNNVVRYCDIYGGSVGDVYDTLDEAALAWAREFLDASINADREYAYYFYPKDGGYSYSDPIIGEAHHVKKPFPHDPSDYGGSIHTHGAESPGYADEDFSKADKQNVNTYGKPGYLVTPSGKLKRMMPFEDPKTIVNNVRE